ncbi:uncharacterized protein, partial [Mobula birostris]|uniref:uncharacterized protein n=1 Tax=Mobula birostris TaxID=1983395 RepID=UPI003B28BE94
MNKADLHCPGWFLFGESDSRTQLPARRRGLRRPVCGKPGAPGQAPRPHRGSSTAPCPARPRKRAPRPPGASQGRRGPGGTARKRMPATKSSTSETHRPTPPARPRRGSGPRRRRRPRQISRALPGAGGPRRSSRSRLPSTHPPCPPPPPPGIPPPGTSPLRQSGEAEAGRRRRGPEGAAGGGGKGDRGPQAPGALGDGRVSVRRLLIREMRERFTGSAEGVPEEIRTRCE